MTQEFISIVIPTVNEEFYIGSVIRSLALPDPNYEILVMDGGSNDRTVEIARSLAAEGISVRVIHNPGRIQAAAMNLAAKAADSRSAILVRADAHCSYPPGFARKVAASLRENQAQSVVVPMLTTGSDTCFQKAVAAAQNSRLGNGGAAHRTGSKPSGWVDHGHHAAFDRAFFQRIGGYDEDFAANEDGEYDMRVHQAGGRVWMERDAVIEYHPRKTPGALWKQYVGYGKGRAMTTAKHKARLKLRQLLPPAVVGASAAGLLLSPVFCPAALIPAGYIGACAAFGVLEARRVRGGKCESAMGAAFVIMHVAWALGFASKMLELKVGKKARHS